MSEENLVGGKVNVEKYMLLLQSESDLKVKLQQLFQKMKKTESEDKAEIDRLTELLNKQSTDTTNDKSNDLNSSAEINSLKMELETANAKLNSCRNAYIALEENLKEKDSKIKALKEQLDTKVSAPAKKPTKAPDKKKVTNKKISEKDDLTLISGVGPKLKDKLYSEGITQFAQIAAWKETDISEFDDKLSFKGRIKRDEWVKQAKALMEK